MDQRHDKRRGYIPSPVWLAVEDEKLQFEWEWGTNSVWSLSSPILSPSGHLCPQHPPPPLQEWECALPTTGLNAGDDFKKSPRLWDALGTFSSWWLPERRVMAARTRAWWHWSGLSMEQEDLSPTVASFPVGLTMAGIDSLSDGR